MSYFQVISYFSVKRYLKSETQLKETSAYLASCFLSIQIHRGSDYMMPEVWGGWPHCTQIMKPRRHVSRLLMLCSLFPFIHLRTIFNTVLHLTPKVHFPAHPILFGNGITNMSRFFNLLSL